MLRRTFFKLGGMIAATGLLGSCGQTARKIIPYVVPPDEGINPVQGWYFATTCRICEAGCGIMVRTVEGRAKKVEGNPLHPINSGGTCARGQAAVQQLYHPERVQQPLKRVGDKGTNNFEPISWDEALKLFASKIGEAKGSDSAFVMSNSISDVSAGIANRLLKAMGSDSYVVPATSCNYESFEKASKPYHHNSEPLPYYNIKNAKFILALGADIFESGFSHVHYGYQYGHMRRGVAARRGTMVYVGTRLSITASSADKFIGVRPGVLGILAMGIAHEVLQIAVDKQLLQTVPLGTQGKWLRDLEEYSLHKVSERTGISEEMIEKLAAKFVEDSPAIALAGDDVSANSNGVDSLRAVELLNLLSREIARARGTLEPVDMPETNAELYAKMRDFIGVKREARHLSTLKKVLEKASSGKMKLGIIHNVNPVHGTPASLKVKDALSKVPFVVYIGQFQNDTTQYADLILPENHFLEDWSASVSEYPAGIPIFNTQQPVVNHMYDTRSAGDIIIGAASIAGLNLGVESAEAFVKKMVSEFRAEWPEVRHFDDVEAWETLLSRGGWWSERKEEKVEPRLTTDQLWDVTEDLKVENPAFDGDESHTFYLHPYTTLTMGDGNTTNLPWLLEMPEPMTTVSWNSWVEINPRKAEELGIKDGDILKVESRSGSIEAPAHIYPGVSPETLAIPFGFGHLSFGKHASGRGANANSVIGRHEVDGSGDIAWRGIKVRVEKTGMKVKLVRDSSPEGQYKGEVFQM